MHQSSDKITLIKKIISFNQAWKLSKKIFGDESSLSLALRDQKACLQAELLRDHIDAYLEFDAETESAEPLYSVRLLDGIELPPLGYIRNDAEHIPVRIAEEIFTEEELIKLIKRDSND